MLKPDTWVVSSRSGKTHFIHNGRTYCGRDLRVSTMESRQAPVTCAACARKEKA